MKRFLYLVIALVLFLTSVPTNADLISPQLLKPTLPKSKTAPALPKPKAIPIVAPQIKPAPIPPTVKPTTAPPKVKQISDSTAIKPATAPLPIEQLQGHFKNKIKIIFSDIDGTLIPFDKNATSWSAPESVKQSVPKLKKSGVSLVLITGRAYPEVKALAQSIGNENSYIITQQGAEIFNPQGKIIYKDYITNQDFHRIIKDTEVFNRLYGSRSPVYFIIDGKYYSFDNATFPYMWQKKTVLKSFADLPQNAQPSKIEIYEPNPKKIKLIQAYFKKTYPNYHVDLGADVYLSITGATATKGEAVKRLAGILGVDLKNAAVFGDAENDISMLKAVKDKGGLAVALGNAMQKTKNSANFVAAPVTQDGFAKSVDKILANNYKIKIKEKPTVTGNR